MCQFFPVSLNSFKETSNKKFILNLNQDSNPIKITKSIEIVYGLRNFIGNAYKSYKETNPSCTILLRTSLPNYLQDGSY